MYKLWFDTAMLLAEAQHVIALRTLRLARGGASARTEAQRMVTEKFDAATEAAWALAGGAHPQRIVRRYRHHVEANRRRLSGR